MDNKNKEIESLKNELMVALMEMIEDKDHLLSVLMSMLSDQAMLRNYKSRQELATTRARFAYKQSMVA